MTIPNEEIMRVMQGVVDLFLVPKFRELGMNATGKWLDSLEVDARGSNEGVIRGQMYSQWLAKGRAPGARPPITPIQMWVQAKLGIGAPESLGVAFAIANKIAKEGTTWYPNGSDLLEVLQSVECIDYVTRELAILGRTQVKIEFNRMAQKVSV